MAGASTTQPGGHVDVRTSGEPSADGSTEESATETARRRLASMLEARTVAVVGASDRPGSFGARLVTEALRSASYTRVHLVHPERTLVRGRPCLRSLTDVPEPVDLVLLGVPDSALVEQVELAAARGDAGAVVFGSAVGLGQDLRAAAGELALCGGGCMGFVNVTRGVRAIGYIERADLNPGGIALISHSGSVFSALLRTHRRLEYALAVSSGQELVTSTADYLDYALSQPSTRVVGLFMETLRDASSFRAQLARAAELDVPVVALTVGGSAEGRRLVEAHSGALAGDDAAWEALFTSYGAHRVASLEELVDTLEAFGIGRRRASANAGQGWASVHDSGAERVLVADVAADEGVTYAELASPTRAALAALVGPGLEAANPLDVWSTGADTAGLVSGCLTTMARDDSVGVVALAIDLVPEYDGDDAYPEAVEATLRTTEKPVVVLANLAASVDQVAATRLRAQGVPVFEGTRSGVRAIGHLLADRSRSAPAVQVEAGGDRQLRWREVLAGGCPDQATSMAMLADYGLAVARTAAASTAEEATAAADEIGYPVVLKTDARGIGHKLGAGGVVMGLRNRPDVDDAYRRMEARLGPRVVVQPQLPPGPELCLGVVRDPLVGPLVLVALGGSAVEALDQRRLGLPPLDTELAAHLLDQPPVRRLLARVPARVRAGTEDAQVQVGVGMPMSVVRAVLAISQLAVELGDDIEALDVNPVLLTADGPVAVDALVVPRMA